MPEGGNDIRPGLGLGNRRFLQQLQGGVIQHPPRQIPRFQIATVAVGGVFTQAGVHNHHQIRHGFLHRRGGFLHDAAVVPSARRVVILSVGNAKQNDGGNA
jgi:hypothetical protein